MVEGLESEFPADDSSQTQNAGAKHGQGAGLRSDSALAAIRNDGHECIARAATQAIAVGVTIVAVDVDPGPDGGIQIREAGMSGSVPVTQTSRGQAGVDGESRKSCRDNHIVGSYAEWAVTGQTQGWPDATSGSIHAQSDKSQTGAAASPSDTVKQEAGRTVGHGTRTEDVVPVSILACQHQTAAERDTTQSR